MNAGTFSRFPGFPVLEVRVCSHGCRLEPVSGTVVISTPKLGQTSLISHIFKYVIFF